MKNLMKKIVAFLCVLTLSVGAMAAWTPAKEVKATEASTDPTPVYLEGFKHVTLNNFTNNADGQMADGTYNTDKVYYLRDNDGKAVENFDKTLISFRIKYSGGDGPKLRLGGSNTSGLDTGFQFYPSTSGKGFYILNKAQDKYPMVNNGESAVPNILTRVLTNGNTEYLTETFFKDNEFLLQLSFEYVDSNNDGTDDVLKLGIYVDGNPMTLENRSDFSSCSFDENGRILMPVNATNMGYHGASFAFESMSDTNRINISSVVAENNKLTSTTWSDFIARKATGEPIYLEGFKHVTLNNFTNNADGQMADGTYNTDKVYYLRDNDGKAVENFDKTLISFRIKYSGGDGPKLRLGGSNTSGLDTGFQFYPSTSGKGFYILNKAQDKYPMVNNGESAVPNILTRVLTNGNTEYLTETFFKDNEFLLQLSFEYVDSNNDGTDDVLKLGIYVDGNPMTLENRSDFSSCSFDENGRILMPVNATNMGYHGACFAFENMSDTNTIQISSVVSENVSKVTIPNKAFLKSGQKAYVLKDSDAITQLANTSFEGKVTFLSATDDDMIYYGGGEAGYGLRLSACNNGEQLKLHLGVDELYLDAATAGVTSFLNNEFCLKITTEYADYDDDEDSNDIQLGIYIDGKLYNNRYLYAYDYTNAGNYVTIDSNEKGIMLRSVTAGLKDVTYDLSQGPYSITTDFGVVTKVMKGNTEMTFNTGLNVAGDYTLHNENELVGEMILYQAGDVHPDSETDVRDLVAMMKVNANVAFDTWAGTMGAYKVGFSETEIINNLLSITEQ